MPHQQLYARRRVRADLVQNYFNYFTEIEEHFQRRRGTTLLLTTLDWSLIEVWKDAGLPLEAVLRGIDAAFDHFEKRPSPKKVNSLAFCSQEVLAAAEEMKEAAVGASVEEKRDNSGFQTSDIVAFLQRNAEKLTSAALPSNNAVSAKPVAVEAARTLHDLADELSGAKVSPRLEDIERRLTVLEEKLFAILLSVTPDEQLVAIKRESDRELAPYRRKMAAMQIELLQKQFLQKRLLEKYGLPRLSLFYM